MRPVPRRRRRRVERVVDQVADHRGEVAREGAVDLADVGLGQQPQLDAALAGQAGLGDQQRRQRRVRDPGGDLVVQRGAAHPDAVDEAHHLVVLLEVQQAGDRVQLVGELVGLGAQRVAGRPAAAELALQGRQLGAVAQGRDRADHRAARAHRPAVEGQHPVPHEHQAVRAGLARGQHLDDLRVEVEVVEPAPDALRGQLQQLPGAVVDQRHAELLVECDHPLLDAVHERLAVLDQPGDLGRLHAERLPLHPARQQQRAAEPEHAGDPEVDQQVGDHVPEPAPHRRHPAADRGQPDDVARRCPGRAPARPRRRGPASCRTPVQAAPPRTLRAPAPAGLPTWVGSDETSTTPSMPATQADVEPDRVRADSVDGGQRPPVSARRPPSAAGRPGRPARFSAALSAGRTSLRSKLRADCAIEMAPTATSTASTMSTWSSRYCPARVISRRSHTQKDGTERDPRVPVTTMTTTSFETATVTTVTPAARVLGNQPELTHREEPPCVPEPDSSAPRSPRSASPSRPPPWPPVASPTSPPATPPPTAASR